MFSLSFTRKDAVRVMWAAVFAFAGVFYPLATGLSKFKNLQEAKAAAIALIPAAIAAALSAIKNAVLADGALKG